MDILKIKKKLKFSVTEIQIVIVKNIKNIQNSWLGI